MVDKAAKAPVLEGYMKKLKTMKRKYFVLFADTITERANLRYYDTEKKFRQAVNKREPISSKRCIILKDCFSINRKLDTKHPNVLALYTKDECFSIVFEEDKNGELQNWLVTMLRLQRQPGLNSSDEPPKPMFGEFDRN